MYRSYEDFGLRRLMTIGNRTLDLYGGSTCWLARGQARAYETAQKLSAAVVGLEGRKQFHSLSADGWHDKLV